MKTKALLPLLLALALPAFALPRPNAATYAWGAQLSVSGYSGANAFSGVPVLVRLAENSPSGFSYSQLQSPTDGADLCFIDMLGNGLPFEIDTWNTSGESLVWVLLPTLESTTQFVMCWGGATSGKTVCADNPWSGYKGVWHMNAVSPADASGCGNDGTASGDVALATGAVGSALSYPNQNAFVTCGQNLSNADLAAGYTMEGWVNLANTSGNKAVFGKDSFISLRMEGSSIKITTPGVSDYGNVNNFITAGGEWHHVALTFVPNTTGGAKIYLDGVGKSAQDTGRIGNTTSSTELWIARNQWGGGQGFTGLVDEYRVYPGVRSAEWLAVSYAAQADAAFLTPGVATPYEATSAPQVGLAVSAVQYTNATFTASVGSLGMDSAMSADASWADLLLVVGADDTLATPLFAVPFDRATAAPSSASTVLRGLVTNTTYYAQLRATNSFDVAGESGVVSFKTLNPGLATGVAAFASRGFTTLSGTGYATDFGAGSSSAAIRLEASSDGFSTIAGASSEIPAVLGESDSFSISGLAPATSYALRLRMVNEWGLVSYASVANPAATLDVPLSATGIGYVFSADGSTVDLSFGVSEVFDGAACLVALEYDGKPVSSKQVSTAGTLLWAGVPSAGKTATATVTVTADVGGTTYTQTWTETVTPGSTARVASMLSDLRGLPVRVGDSIALPALTGADDYYLLLDARSFELGADGKTLTAVEPGFTTVAAFEYDAATGTFVRNATMGLAICLPDAAGSVFVADAAGASMNWSDEAKWTCVFDAGAAGPYPNGIGDVALVPLAAGKTLTLDADATVGALYVGFDESAPASGQIRLAGNNKTLTFRTGEKDKPGMLRITGLGRRDVLADNPEFYLGSSGSGNRLGLAIPDGLELDGGKHPDVADTTLRGNHNRLVFRTGYGLPLSVPAGKTLRIVHFDHAYRDGADSQMGNCSNFIWWNGVPIVGEGTVSYEGPVGYFDSALKDFAGTLVVRQLQKYDGCGIDNRGGGFWLMAGVGYEAANATFVIEGHCAYSHDNWFPASVANSLGVAIWGCTHGWGSWGPGDNSFGGKAMVLAGGTLLQRGNASSGWATAGIGVNPNRSDALVVSNGFSCIDTTSYNGTPTNQMEFASLRHEGRGTLRVTTSDTVRTDGNADATPSHVIAHGFADHAIGAGGADGSGTESIVPWIVCSAQWFNRLYFPHLGTSASDGTADCIVRALTHPTSKDGLKAATNPDENVFVSGKSMALDADLTVNSLVLNGTWDKGTALGAGRTLTITSGGLALDGERSAIGKESDYTAGTAGTLSFSNEGYVYSSRQSLSQPNEIWAAIVAPKGLAISFPGYFRMGGDQTGIDEEIAVNGCDVTLGSSSTGCQIDVPVRLESGAATLRIGKPGSFCRQDLYLNDHAGFGPKFVSAAGTEEVVHKLFVNGVSVPRGYYGSSEAESSFAALADHAHPAFVDDRHFSGTGWVKVMTDEVVQPTLLILK